MSDTATKSRKNIFGRTFVDINKEAHDQVASWVGEGVTSPTKQKPLSLTASAARITGETVKSSTFRKTVHEEWQDDAWAMYDLVGEQRFLSTNLAARCSQARFYVGKLGHKNEEAPIQVDDESIAGLLEAIGDGHLGLSQLVQRLALNLFITGDGWLAGIPKDMMPDYDEDAEDAPSGRPVNRNMPKIDRHPSGVGDDYSMPTLDKLEWRMLSVSEIKFEAAGEVELILGAAESERIRCHPDDIYLIRVWRPHPRRWWQADSPTRSSLPVLRELVGLTMHISAQIDSRLAGAGLLIVPQSAAAAMKRAANIPDDSPEDPFTDALMAAMLTPISDRSNAAAFVPLVITVPDEAAALFQHITFDKPLDTEARQMRDEAIRRLALGQDAPPELLLGTGGMNHWGAWLVREDVVSAHLEPVLALICDALTTQYLRPILVENGMSAEEAEEYVIWYDVSHMIIRPNRSSDAKELYKEGVISDKTLREANGFDEADAPDEDTDDPAIVAAFEMVQANPGLMRRPGLDVIVAQLRALLNGDPLGAIDGASRSEAAETVSGGEGEGEAEVSGRSDASPSESPADPSEVSLPETSDAPARPPAMARALEMVLSQPVRGGLKFTPKPKDLRGSLSQTLTDIDEDVIDLTRL